MTAGHPSPGRRKVGWLRASIGLFLAPLTWMAQMSLSAPLAASACYPHETPLPAPQWEGLSPFLAAVSALCVAVCAGSWIVSWISWRRTRHELPEGAKTVVEVGEGRTRFLAMLGLFSNSLFLVATLFTGCAILMVSPCHPWF